jgi:hypothetical protein
MSALSQKKLETWIDRLCGNTVGKIIFINMFLSLDQDLISKEFLRKFLIDCVSIRSKNVEVILDNIDKLRRNDEYLAHARIDSFTGENDVILAMVMDSAVFHSKIINEGMRGKFLPRPLSHSDKHEEDYKRQLTELQKLPNWYDNKSTLGTKEYGNVPFWFSDLKYIHSELETYNRGYNEATKMRDILGLITCMDCSYLVKISFPLSALLSVFLPVSDHTIARPICTDPGNQRFSTYFENAEAKKVYRNHWGMTSHLGKIAERTATDIIGAPERICKPVPFPPIVESLPKEETMVEPIGWVQCNRGLDMGIDDDDVFIVRLQDGNTEASMKNRLLEIADIP